MIQPMTSFETCSPGVRRPVYSSPFSERGHEIKRNTRRPVGGSTLSHAIRWECRGVEAGTSSRTSSSANARHGGWSQ